MPVEEDLMRAVLLTFGTAMVPVLELRGAIPVGVAAGLSPAAACAVSVLGNMVPVPFILLLIRRIFDFLRGTRLFGPKIQWLERRAHLKGRVVRKYRLPGLIILVAIPLPGTGAWTGALVAALLDIRHAPRGARHLPGRGHRRRHRHHRHLRGGEPDLKRSFP